MQVPNSDPILYTMPPRLLKTSVRELVGFVLRSGDLIFGGFSRPDRLVEGTRGHQKVQRARPADYQAEVPISYLVETDEIALEISGRIDGLLVEDDAVLIEEIKTTEADLDEIPENPTHWAQAKLYAFMVAEQSGLDTIDVQLTYLQLDTYERREDRRTFAHDELAAFCADLIERYLHWARIYQQWCAERDLSLEALAFPFAEYRPGQRDLAAATYRTIDGRGRAFAQAPTGIGKTISTLFPAAKALGLGHAEKNLLPDGQNQRTQDRRKGHRRPARRGRTPQEPDADGPRQDLLQTQRRQHLRPRAMRVRPRLLRPHQRRA